MVFAAKKLGYAVKLDCAVGRVTLTAGSAVVTTGLKSIESHSVQSETANRAYATKSGGTLTITGTGTDAVNWQAWGKK